ncbi:SCO family protein [Geobacillus stearothermophilus]|uniref:SCO family protein n=1 Tax=Geobacillus stearothermophilus TaxID=1422 RepID=UPI001F415DBC|nr:SCO family protein [Geobacillus stearothermophilus]
MRKIVAVALVLLFGFGLLWHGTDGFRAFTSETARRLAILQEPKPLPTVRLEDQNGRTFSWQDQRGQWVLATFMYTRCGDVCPVIEMNLRRIYDAVRQSPHSDRLSFLSISFDSQNDTPEMLMHHAHHYGADGVTWRMARVPNDQELQRLLEVMGVIVIPDEKGGYEHNAAFYLLDEKGRLVRIFDYNNPQAVSAELNRLLAKETSAEVVKQ